MIPLRQATASQEVPLGHFLDSTDGNSEETGLTIANTDVKVWKYGATTLANKNSGGATHISNGIYYAVLDATDTDTAGPLVLFVHVAGALVVRLECCVYPAKIFDSMILGSDNFEVDATLWNGHAVLEVVNGSPVVTLGATQAAYAPSKAGDAMALTAAAIDANWDEILSGHVGAGSMGKALTDILAFGAPPTAAVIRTEMDSNSTRLSAIVGYIDTEVAAILAAVDTEVAAIKTQTDKLTFTIANELNCNARYWNGHTVLEVVAGSPVVTLGAAQAAYAPSKAGDAMALVATQAVNVSQWGGQNIATPAINGEPVVTLASAQAAYAPAKAGDAMTLTAATIDAAWDEILSGHVGAGSMGKALADILAFGVPPTAAVIRTEMDSNSTRLSAIVGYIDTEIAAILAAVDTEVAAIKLKTDNLPASPAAVGSKMDIVDAPSATGVGVIVSAIWDKALTGITSVGSVGKLIKDNLAAIFTAFELDGAVYRLSVNALENAPAGEGSVADWTSDEKEQIRDALGVTGDKTAASGGQIQFLVDRMGGKTKLIGNQLICYKADNATEVCRFDLKDSTGLPSMTNIYEKDRV